MSGSWVASFCWFYCIYSHWMWVKGICNRINAIYMYDDWHSLDFSPLFVYFQEFSASESQDWMKPPALLHSPCTAFDARLIWWKALSLMKSRKNELILMLEKIKIWLKIGKCALCQRQYHDDCICILGGGFLVDFFWFWHYS